MAKIARLFDELDGQGRLASKRWITNDVYFFPQCHGTRPRLEIHVIKCDNVGMFGGNVVE